MQRGDTYLASFPFGDAPGMKLRPVLLLTGPIGTGKEVIVAYISSVTPESLLSTDVTLDPAEPDHASAGLKMRSVLRLHKIATIHVSVLQRRLGEIPPSAKDQVRSILLDMLSLGSTDKQA